MKLTAKQYAEILVNIVSKAPAAAERFSETFWDLLRENHQEKLFPAIMRRAQVIWNEKHGLVDVVATVPAELSDSEEKAVAEKLETALAKKINLKVKVDASLKGGIILQIEDNSYDASVAGRLKRLERQFQIS